VKITEASPRYLSEQERIQIADLLAARMSVRRIAEQLGRARSTISREIRRNSDPDGRYRPHQAEQAARRRADKPRTRRLAVDGVLAEVVGRLLAKRRSPHSPWQRGSYENMNGVLRNTAKGTDLSVHCIEDVARIPAEVNDRPRNTLDWQRPRSSSPPRARPPEGTIRAARARQLPASAQEPS
jgi:IS30 family transposase